MDALGALRPSFTLTASGACSSGATRWTHAAGSPGSTNRASFPLRPSASSSSRGSYAARWAGVSFTCNQLPFTLPPPDEQLPEEVEVELSRAVAAASEKLLQRNEADVAQQQAQAMQQDPVVQMQQKELAIKEGNLQRQLMKDQREAQLRELDIMTRNQRERERIASQEKVAGAQIGAQIVEQEKDLSVKERLEGVKLGVEIGTKGLSNK